jgi:sigma-B regulation protein RsbU (phosphoserine phosphatase)
MGIMRAVFSKLPLKVTAPILLTVPVLVVVVALSTVVFIHGRNTADDLATQLLHEVHGRIQNRVGTLLRVPARVNQINVDAYRMGQLKLDDVEQLEQYFWRQLKTFEEVSYVEVGTETGDFVGVERMADGTMNLELKNARTGGALHTFKLDEDMQRMSKKVRAEYDPRSRPWYVAAIQAGEPTWSSIYPFFSVPARLGITAVRPISDPDGTVRGVLACDLVLSRINQFLRSLEIGNTGSAFIIERDGMLVASSSEHPSVLKVGDQTKRVHALEFQDAAIRTAAEHIRERFGDFAFADKDRHSSFELGGETILLQVRPIRDKEGLDWLAVTLVPENDFMADVHAGRRRSIAVGAAVLAGTVLLGVLLATLAVRPFLALVGDLRRVGQGDLEHEIRLDHTPEFRQLSAEINTMTAGLRDRMQLRQSLAVAMEVQQNLLPATTPEVEGLDIAGHSTYCDETGGDYYDYLDVTGLSESTVAVAVGDVMGHGIAAAMLMATARGILLSRCDDTGSLAELLTHMNGHLVRDVGEGSGRFMTMLLMTIDATRREMRWASAGHDMPMIYDPNDDQFIEVDVAGVPLGILAGESYEERTLPGLRTGQVFLAATDGLWESHNQAGDAYGKDRLRELVRRGAALSADEISRAIREDLAQFCGESRQEDDVTFVIVKVL